MYEVSNQFKEYCKRHQRTFKNCTITYEEDGTTKTIDASKILKLELSSTPYVDYQIIGQAPSKKMHINLYGQNYDLTDKEISITTTMIYDNNSTEVLNLGTYIVTSDYDSSVKDQSSFTAYDYMIKMDNEYSDEGLTYPCTIRDVLENICEQKDIELATEYLPNGDLKVIGNNFQDGATYRDVIKQIAQVNGTFAYIDRENKLHIDQLMNHDTLQGEGTSITLSGTTAYGNIIDYMLEGNTTQDGTPTPTSPIEVNNVTGEQVVRVCGKNLLQHSAYDRSLNGITLKVNNDKSITLTGTATANTNFNIGTNADFTLGAGTYTFSKVATNVQVLIYYSSASVLANLPIGTQTKTFTLNNDTIYNNYRVVISIPNGTTVNETVYPMLEKGSTATIYEEYKGKDYEIDLTSRNLLDYTQLATRTENGVTITNNGDGTFSVNGTATADISLAINNETFVPMSGTWRMVGCPSGGSSSTYMLSAYVGYWGGGSPNIDTGNGTSITYTGNVKVRFYIKSGTTCNNLLFKPMVTYDLNATYEDFSPYFEPIELNKIGNYQDFIRKGTGKNICNNADIEAGFPSGGIGSQIGITASANSITYKKCCYVEKSKTYTLSWKRNTPKAEGSRDIKIVDENNIILESIAYSNASSIRAKTFTPNNSGYIYVAVDTNATEVQIEENSSATYYEPYGYKDKWYLEKNVGKVVLNGSESWSSGGTNTTGYIRFTTSTISTLVKTPSANSSIANILCNNYEPISADASYQRTQGMAINTSGIIQIYDDVFSTQTTANFKTWLQSNNTKVYYVLANPTYTLIENEELLNQLDGLNNGYTYADTTNILSNGNLPTSLSMSIDVPYRDAEEEITPSNYLTDFKQSREYGPVNRVQITMTDVEDAIYIENHDSINKDGIQTITINDNYFLSSEELKAEAIRPLWNSLYTMKYMPIKCTYLGLPYIEMGDYLNVTMPNGDVKGTYVFNYKFIYNGGYMGELETPTISRTQETYPTESMNSQIVRIGINVDRANARITSEVTERKKAEESLQKSILDQTSSQISSSVSSINETLYGENDDGLVKKVEMQGTQITQTDTGLQAEVKKTTQLATDLGVLSGNTEEILKRIKYDADGLTLTANGDATQNMALNLTNEAIKFLANSQTILEINGTKIEFTSATFKKLDLGHYVWQAEDDDSLSLIYEDEGE